MKELIYKLNRDELLQAIADYISKRHGISWEYEAHVQLDIQSDNNRLVAKVTVSDS